MRAICLLLPGLLLVVARRDPLAPRRIVEGRPAWLGQFPHQAYIVMDRSYTCGGSLITKRTVLTAAHCLEGFNTFDVWLGGINLALPDTFWATVTPWGIPHPDYTSGRVYYDVAVVFLMEPAPLGRYIRLVSLPSSLEINSSYVGRKALISGWGRTYDASQLSVELQWAELRVYSDDICAHFIDGPYDESIMCAGDYYSGICHGDSGGALVLKMGARYKQIGVNSFVVNGCLSDFPDYFARVTAVLDWIRRKAAESR